MKINRMKIITVCAMLFIAMCATVYYYGLHLSFWPDPEFIWTPMMYYLEERFNYEPSSSGIGYMTGLARLAYSWKGIGFVGVRLLAAFLYFFIILCTAILSLYSMKEKKIKWHVVPLFVFVSVLLNPGSSAACGHHTLAYHVYPYDMHTDAVFGVLFLLVLVEWMLNMQSANKRKMLLAVIGLLMVVGIIKLDLLFDVGFVLPAICVLVGLAFKKDKKILQCVSLGGAAIIALMRFFSLFSVSLQRFFQIREASVYGEWEVYGDRGIISLQDIWTNISSVAAGILALFNVQLDGPVLSVHTIMNLLRILLVLVIFALAFGQIKDSFCKKADQCDYISILSAYGVVAVALATMLTCDGTSSSCIRYMTQIVFLGSILLCRKIDKVCRIFFDEYADNNLYVFFFFLFCCLINFQPFWRADTLYMDYEPALQEVADIIHENQLGDGIGEHWYATTLTSLLEGEYAVLEPRIYDTVSEEVHAMYIVDGNEEGLAASDFFKSFDMDYYFEIYGEPDQVWETTGFTIYYWKNGVL